MHIPKFYTVLSIAALSLVKLAGAHDTSLASVKYAFQGAHIPEDLRLIFEPKIHLKVTYFLDDRSTFDVYPGAPLARHDTAYPPMYNVSGCHVGAGPFVVTMIDPGPQLNPNITQVRHFLGGDYYYNELNGVFYNRTPAVTEYKQPSPPRNSDPHRLYFDIAKFAYETELGDPIAGNFVLVGPEVQAAV
ncbi:unnamed protein product [Cyclocybe aegerita]|uniref:PEBP-like protein n=1 Tax=Cyclocybe aegerita TaxID=1973307 RepID=A0A8S0W724_CYCAE|nr:unnamed protein product [Cyclocybe aegerita]